MENFLQHEIENFEITENCELESNAKNRNARVRQWCGTWNNPSMTDEEFKAYLEKLQLEEKLVYAIFQREKGEENGTIHFQFYVEFKTPQYFKSVKEKLLPYGCHFAPMISSPERCKDYCSKPETRVSGPYEIGEMSSQGKRTDLRDAIKLIDEGVPFEVVAKIYPTQCLMYARQLKERGSMFKGVDYNERFRDVETTYIYGEGGVGKTTGVYLKYGFKDVFIVSNYEKYLFEGYDLKKIIVFDEFASQIKITQMNRYLDRAPIRLRGLGKSYVACYDKVIILSNLPLSRQYTDLEVDELNSRDPFLRRIHHVIYVDKNGVEHKEKETIFRDLRPDEMVVPGISRDIDRVIYYDRSGKVTKIDYKQKVEQMEIFEETPFDEGVE